MPGPSCSAWPTTAACCPSRPPARCPTWPRRRPARQRGWVQAASRRRPCTPCGPERRWVGLPTSWRCRAVPSLWDGSRLAVSSACHSVAAPLHAAFWASCLQRRPLCCPLPHPFACRRPALPAWRKGWRPPGVCWAPPRGQGPCCCRRAPGASTAAAWPRWPAPVPVSGRHRSSRCGVSHTHTLSFAGVPDGLEPMLLDCSLLAQTARLPLSLQTKWRRSRSRAARCRLSWGPGPRLPAP